MESSARARARQAPGPGVAKAKDPASARRAVYELQAAMRSVAQSQRERDCGRLVCIEDDPEIRVRSDEGQRRASFSGLLRCGHVWTCAPCSQRIRAKQAKRIAFALEWLKGSWGMLTLTLRHDAGMRLKETLRALKRAWRKMRMRRDIRTMWKALALSPVTATEVTYGGNGWHPHLHIAFKVGKSLAPFERALFEARWAEAVTLELGSRARPDAEHGVTWSRQFDADAEGERAMYVSKLGLALEVSDAGLAKSSRSHWEIARAASKGDQRAYALWVEYCEATKGQHVVQLSPEASTAAKLGAESHARYDDPAPHVEPENIRLPCSVLRAMRAREVVAPSVFHDALRAAELGGSEGFASWVRSTFQPRTVHVGDPP